MLLECPRCRAPLAGDARLECRCGGYPVVAGIPIVTDWARGRDVTVEEALARHFEPVSELVEKLRRRVGLRGRVRRAIETHRTFLSLAEALGRRSDVPYFRVRLGDPSYLGPCALLTAASETPLLDLGCGPGFFERALARRLPARGLVGVDLNFTYLYLAKRFLAPDCSFVCADASARLPFPDRAFRTVVCIHAFNYFPDREAAAREIRRVGGPAWILARLADPNFAERGAQPALPAEWYLERFPGGTLYPDRVFLERFLRDGTCDLSPAPPEGVLTLLAGLEPRVVPGADYFVGGPRLDWNPAFEREMRDGRLVLRRTGAEPAFLPAELTVDPRDRSPELVRRFILVDDPPGFALA